MQFDIELVITEWYFKRGRLISQYYSTVQLYSYREEANQTLFGLFFFLLICSFSFSTKN